MIGVYCVVVHPYRYIGAQGNEREVNIHPWLGLYVQLHRFGAGRAYDLYVVDKTISPPTIPADIYPLVYPGDVH